MVSLQRLLSEPLFHFLIIGLIFFGIDKSLESARVSASQIIVPASVYEDISRTFEKARSRKPTKEELAPLVETWVSNEVLYREAKAQQLDEGDDMIRERIIQKLRVMISGTLDVPKATEEDLRSFFQQHRQNYDQPTLYSFTFAKMESENEAAQRASALNAGVRDAVNAPGIRFVPFKRRPESNVMSLLGKDNTKILKNSSPGQWIVMTSQSGVAVARLDSYVPAQAARYEDVASDVAKRWQVWASQQAGRKRVAELRAKYDVAYQPPATTVYATDGDGATEIASSTLESR
jgi:hypothetical protein